MKISELTELLYSSAEDDEELEVVIVVDGREYDIAPETEILPASFDGFATFSPPSLALKAVEKTDGWE